MKFGWPENRHWSLKGMWYCLGFSFFIFTGGKAFLPTWGIVSLSVLNVVVMAFFFGYNVCHKNREIDRLDIKLEVLQEIKERRKKLIRKQSNGITKE